MKKAVKTINGDIVTLKIYSGEIKGFNPESTLWFNLSDNKLDYYIKLLNLEIVSEKISYFEAFEKFIVGQTVVGEFNTQLNYIYPTGVLLSNGYKLVHYGGSCSGDDCNYSYILDKNNVEIASQKN